MFPNQPDPFGDQIALLSDEVQECDRRKTGLSLSAAIRAIRDLYPTAKSLDLIRGAYGLTILEAVTLADGYVLSRRCLRNAMGWSDCRSHLWQVNLDTLKECGLAEEDGPIVTATREDSSIVLTATVDIDAFLLVPPGLWYPRRPGEPQLGPKGHRNAVLTAIFPSAVPAPTAPADDLTNA